MKTQATLFNHPHYNSIFLSSHLDDAILSCGGIIRRLTRAGQSGLIVSVLAGDPPQGGLSDFALSLHTRWQLGNDAVARRRAEDVNACNLVGADWLHWPVPECIYRQNDMSGDHLYTSEESLFDSVKASEVGLIAALARRIDSLPSFDALFAPLAAGNHVDHQLTRLAAELSLGPAALTYYEDYPYAQNEGNIAAALDEKDSWRSEVIRLELADIDTKIGAIACYESQTSTFFRDHQDLAHQVGLYTRQVGGERLWFIANRNEGSY